MAIPTQTIFCQKAKNILISSLFIILTACAPVKYYTYIEGGHDPSFDIKSTKTIGLVPFCYRYNEQCDELTEKQFLAYAQNELQKRGFTVFYIPKEYLEYFETEKGVESYVKADYENMPDLILNVWYHQDLGNVVHVPGQSGGSINWNSDGGKGSYRSTEGYNVQTYFLQLQYTLWSGKPKYMEKIWRGVLKKGSPKLDLLEQAQTMTKEIFHKKF
jgi:hypothetical protein